MNEIEETSSQEVKTGKEIIIDYLTGSHEFLCNDNEVELQVVEDTVEFFRQLLNVPKERVVPMEFGKGNYRYGYQIGDGVTYKLCGPLNDKGIHTNCLEMKGEGCREFERNNGVDAWEKFLFILGCSSIKFRCSRLDLTIDHYEHKGVTFDWVKSKLDKGMYTSGFKKPYTIHGSKEDGYSLTFGKRKADNKLSKQLCIYEKDKEQRAKGKECNQENWTRFEMRFMHEKAQRVFDDLLYAYMGEIRYPEKRQIPKGIEGFKIFVASLLYSLLDIKVVYSLFSRIPFNLSAILNGANVQEKTALKLSQAVGIPLNKLFDKKVKEEAYAEYTIFGKKKILKTIFEFAINVLRIIHENPAKDGMTKNSFQTKRRESLSEEQAIKFYEATKEFDIMIQTAMHMSLLTGMRPAEMGGLEWKDIDFSYKTITIERNAIKCDKMGIILKGTKANKARTISIPEILVEQLIKYRKWQQDWIESLGDYYKDDDQVFSQSDGSRVTTDIFNKWFKKVRDKAELPEKFTLYNLRHTNLSILVGYVPITTVAQRAGHSTIKTTEEYYIHRVSEADMQASQTLNNVFKTSFENQTKGKEEIEIEEYKRSLEKMKQLGFKTLKEYFEYLNYMKSKGFNIPL